MKITGSCHCGAIGYEAEIDPASVCICHCTDCQTLSGSAFRTVAFAPEHSFKLLKGTPTVYVKTADSGNKREQTFCSACGSPLYSRAADRPIATAPPPPGAPVRMLGLRVGAIAERGQLVPKVQYFCRSAQPWAAAVVDTPRHTGDICSAREK